MDRTAVIEVLRTNNSDFKRIYDKHQSYERELEEFSGRHHLTPNEEMTVKNIKKNKLLLKDKMEAYINNFIKNN